MNRVAVNFLETLLVKGVRLLSSQHWLPSKVLEACSAVNSVGKPCLRASADRPVKPSPFSNATLAP
jgi:hypothetical protein